MFPKLPFSIPAFILFGHSFGPIYIHTYGLCMAVALGTSIYLYAKDSGKWMAPKIGLSYSQAFQKAFDLGIYVIVFSLIGARIFYVLENHDQFQKGNWYEVFFIWQGGVVFYGGLFGAVAAAFYWFRAQKWPLAYSFDLTAPYILLGHAIGRVGCFLNGCCYGNQSSLHDGLLDLGHGWIFPGGEDQLPHLPTQIWEMIGDLALFWILFWARRRTLRYPWLSISLYGLTYGILRFVIEFWRRDWDKRYLLIFNSASQAVSGILIILSIAAILWIFLRKKKPATVRQSP